MRMASEANQDASGRKRRFFLPLFDHRGVTLAELMVSIAVLSVVGIATSFAYNEVMRSLVLSVAQGVAVRLAQDELETLGGLPYVNLMVTTQSDLNIPPGVDLTYYPLVSINMAGKSFTRSVIVSRAYKNSSGQIILLSPSAADTGLKQVEVIVNYMEGNTPRQETLNLLVSNPGLVPLNSTIYGVVSDTAGAAVPTANVFVTENPNWTTIASSTGYYQIPIDTQPYTITATKSGYWDDISSTITCLSSCQQNFQLQAHLTGSVGGLVTARPPSPRISGVYAGNGGDNNDYLELYNPTTAPFLITNGFTAKIQIQWIPQSDVISPVTFSWGDSNPHSIPAQGYYLIATSSPTVNNVSPDAVFASPTSPFSSLAAGGVAIQDNFGVAMDSVGWTSGSGNPGPSNGVETAGVLVSIATWGQGGFLERFSTSSGSVSGIGHCFDSNDNATNIAALPSVLGSGYPHDSQAIPEPAEYGIPASSAAMLATDGYSAGTFASTTGYYLLNSVTTGTWAVAGYWTAFSTITVSSIVVNSGAYTPLDLLLEPTAVAESGVAGQVLRSDTFAPLAGIKVSVGIQNTLTNAAGDYVLSLSTGYYSIRVNDGFSNINYNTVASTVTDISTGIISGINFNLLPSGLVSGQVTTDGTDPYPGISVQALSGGLQVATAVTDSFGNYTIYGVPATADQISPILNPSQASTPASINVTVAQGQTSSGNNFIITSNLAQLSGTVTQGGTPITTGVLIVASTTSWPSLPIVNNAFRAGSTPIYDAVSDTVGNYNLSIVGNSSYTINAYYTSLNGSGTSTSQKSDLIYVSTSGQVNFAW